MDDLTSLFESKSKSNDLIEKLIGLLDRQTDHKLTPNMLLGFLSLFNMLSIMSLVHDNSAGGGLKEVSGSPTDSGANVSGQSVKDMVSSLLGSQTGGQPDLMGLLGGLASKKKINPSLLLSLFSMLNNQSGQAAPVAWQNPVQSSGTGHDAGTDAGSGHDAGSDPVAATEAQAVEATDSREKDEKNDNTNRGVELKYDRRRGH